MDRQEFTPAQKELIFWHNAHSLIRVVSGIEIAESHLERLRLGQIYFCENCKFCQTDRRYFDIDHLVPDKEMRGTGRASNILLNGIVLCKSYETGARGCNQTKGASLYPPPDAGLARTRPHLDLNYLPMIDRDANRIWFR